MKKYIPEHMLTIAASLAPIVITAASYCADTILGTEGIIGWGGLAVGLVSAIILLNSDAVVWKSKEENDDNSELLAQSEREKSILNVKMATMQGRLDSAINAKLAAEQKLYELEQKIKEMGEVAQKEDIEKDIYEEPEVFEMKTETKPEIEEISVAEVELSPFKEEIDEAEDDNGDFCGVGFKEYRNAVTSFAANTLRPAYLIRKELLSLDVKGGEKYVDAVSTSLESIIYISNLEKTNAPLKFEDCDLNELIKDCMKKVSATISEKKIGTLRKGLEMTVNTDQRWLSVAVTHILMNAVNHLSPFGKIAVSGRKDEDGVYIVVEDSSNGCDKNELEHIFEPGFITEAEKANNQMPNGMSMFIAKHAVEHIGGEIVAESIKGKGTRIHVRLPYKK